ncbi:MAG: curli-like amyloid fiber formation chaperone CsgH [Hyphomicrobium sp.]|nr:curli-like amyloid fiber formation chaperone CsgH [Hyphomicrobium sp.]
MKSFAILPALAAVAAAGAVLMMDGAEAGTSGVSCEIRATKSNAGVDLEAVVTSAKATTGTYKLMVSHSGVGGASDIEQAGDFTLEAGETAVVGEASVGGADVVRAKLSVSTAAGSANCRL